MILVSNYLNRLLDFQDKICIVDDDKQYKYLDLIENINSIYELLKNTNIRSGELVALVGDYSFNSISFFLALCKNNNVIIPITSKNINEINDRIAEARPEWVINLDDNSFVKYSENINIKRHDLIQIVINRKRAGLILFSSGTTGKPKAMIHDLSNLISTYTNKKQKSIVFLVFLMFDHIGGLNTLFNCLAMGSTIVIPTNRTPKHICHLIEKYNINVLPSSPTFLNLIIISREYANYKLTSLKLITYGTEAMPDSLLLKLKDIFPNVKFLQTFGTSETGIAKTTSKSSTSTFIKIEDGDQEYKVVKNELWLRSKTQILGYINHNNDSFTSDGWFKTGDLVEEIEGNYLKIKGRIKEIINVGGEKVTPSEVESTILEIPEVLDCVVFGEMNSITGQMVVAKVVLGLDCDELIFKRKLRLYCKEKLEKYKVPSKIIFLKQIEFSERFKKDRFNNN
jgi:acyl-coenzyme A synthetase/AMP-(fatty) acid ligase